MLSIVAKAQGNHSHYGPVNPTMCGQHVQQEKYFQEHPEHKAQHDLEQAEFQTFYEHYLATEYDANQRSSYVIPVVIHVTHLGGADNISDAQIKEALIRLNDDFNGTNDDIGNTISAFQGIIGNPDVEFRLATKDPNGNCHSGITRTYSENTTHTDGDLLIADIQAEHGIWPQNKYMNVIVCQDPNSFAGYAYYPASWYNENGMGGAIFMRHDYMGTIGTSNMSARHTLTHEVGHWLNLYHCWGNNNDPAQSGSCSTDDGVLDTPETIGWLTCNINGSTCSSLDNVQNIMEYSYCSTMFTEGQVARMHAALNSSTAGRNKLWNNNSPYFNLAATGVDAPADLCEVAFSANRIYICEGESIDFSDDSYHNVTSRTWAFSGGLPATSTDANPVVTYANPGVYNVSLEVSDGTSTQSETKNSFVRVLSDPGESLPYSEGFENLTSIPDNESWMVYDQSQSDPWGITSSAGSQGSSSSAKLLNFGNTVSSIDEFISGSFDLSVVDPSDEIVFTFDYAYKKRIADNDEWLQFYISKDCGETWALRKNIHDDDLSSEIESASYTPASASDWHTVNITNITSLYYVADFRFKFLFESDNGNNIYLDNINMYPNSMSGITDSKVPNSLKIYPNPAHDVANIQILGMVGEDVNVSVLNSLGQEVELIYNGTFQSEVNDFVYDTSTLPKGLYFVKVESEERFEIVKLMIH